MTKILCASLMIMTAAAPAYAQAGRSVSSASKAAHPVGKYWLSASLTTLAYGARAGETKMSEGQQR